MGAQEEMQAQCLSSTWPWSAAAQEQSYSAFAKMAFQGGLVCSHKTHRANSSKCLLISWKPKSFRPPIWGQPGGNISCVVPSPFGTSPSDFGPEPKRLGPVQELKVTAPVRGWHTPWALKTLPEKPGVALGPKNGARETGTGHGA